MRSCNEGLTNVDFGGFLNSSTLDMVWKVNGSSCCSVGVRGPDEDDADDDEDADDMPGGDDMVVVVVVMAGRGADERIGSRSTLTFSRRPRVGGERRG